MWEEIRMEMHQHAWDVQQILGNADRSRGPREKDKLGRNIATASKWEYLRPNITFRLEDCYYADVFLRFPSKLI